MNDRKNIMLGTAGHVDHGKTAVVKMLTGCNLDTLAEEQKRGLTIDLGFAPCRMANERIVGIVDVPGHVDFIRNMVAGAHGIDVVIFVVAADDGVMPQTREHLDIITLMGVRGGIIALTKIDLVPQDLRQIVMDDLRELVAGTFLGDVPICPVSNITGEGYENLMDRLNAAVDACPQRATGGLFRLWVEDVHAIKGFGTVVTGIPLVGEVAVGDHLTLLPSRRSVRIRKLEVYGEEAQIGRAGECVAMNLADIEAGDIGRGMVLCSAEAFEPVEMAEAHVTLLPKARTIKDYTEVHVHVGTAEATARLAMLEAKEMSAGQGQMIQLRLDRPLGVAAGDRFVIRNDVGGSGGGRLTTIGGGQIVSTGNIRLRRNRPWTLEAMNRRLAALQDPSARVEVELSLVQTPPVAPVDLARACQMKLPEVQACLEALLRQGRAVEIAGRFAHVQAIEGLGGGVLAEMEKFHQANPHRLGMTQDELAAAMESPAALLAMAIESLERGGKLQREGTVLHLAGKGETLAEPQRRLCEKVEAAFRTAHLGPPSVEDLGKSLGELPKRIDAMTRLLVDRGLLVCVAKGMLMHRDAVAAARQVAIDLFEKLGGFETVQFRDALGVSRKYAVPLLDYFDTLRLTVRSGSRRTPGADVKKVLESESPGGLS